MTIGDRIKQRRLELGLSQEELATKCGYKSRSSINKFEIARDIPLRKLSTIARALDISEAELIGVDEDPAKEAETIMGILGNNDDRQYIDMYMALPDQKKKQVKEFISFLSSSES